MSNLLTATYLALLISPFLAILVLIPYMLIVYRKTRTLNVRKTTGFYLMMICVLTAWFLTMLPFPSMETVASLNRTIANLVPFHNVREYLHLSGIDMRNIRTLFPSLVHWTFLEPVFNVFLLMPLGFFLRGLFRWNLPGTALMGFCTSLFFETTQLTGLFFIYPRPYRTFDVDDLITNTTGVVIGWFLYGFAVKILPALDTWHNEQLHEGGGVSMRRRLPALLMDQTLVLAFVLPVGVLLSLFHWRGIPWLFLIHLTGNVILGLGIYVFGNTPGNAIMGLQPRDMDTSGSLAYFERQEREAKKRRMHELHKKWNPVPMRPWQGCLRQLSIGMHLALPAMIAYCIHLSTMKGIITRILVILASLFLCVLYMHGIFEYLMTAITHAQSTYFDRICDIYLTLSADEEKSYRRKSAPRQVILCSGRLSEAGGLEFAGKAYQFLITKGVNPKTARRMEKMTESVCEDWLAWGLCDHSCVLKYDARPWKNTLVLVLFCKKPVHGNDDLEGGSVDMVSGLRLAYSSSYESGAYTFAIDIPSLEV